MPLGQSVCVGDLINLVPQLCKLSLLTPPFTTLASSNGCYFPSARSNNRCSQDRIRTCIQCRGIEPLLTLRLPIPPPDYVAVFPAVNRDLLCTFRTLIYFLCSQSRNRTYKILFECFYPHSKVIECLRTLGSLDSGMYHNRQFVSTNTLPD